VSFEPSTTLASETVQLHLQHKLAQRALAQFRAQAFGEDRLSRVTVVIDPAHKRNRVLALGRLSLFGAGASQLHEEVILAAAFWVEGDDPRRLKPFETAEAEERALESLSSVLARDHQPQVPEHIIRMLMTSAPKDEDALWEKIKARVFKRIFWAEEKLRSRARSEADEMQRILEAQRSALDKELHARQAQHDAKAQLALPWGIEEKDQKEQYDADTKHIQKRRADLDKELLTEPQRIRELYDVKHHRLERVGLVSLWPSAS
jgi:hypothetical protein